ncbi:hypothetical protein FisN_3Lh226 [Fistulifera solaris]|uniref:TLDc domain-containing protein n=1 Tax=Fistulifera solaris TaxID=1519565 RepID=A0A1Z5JP12_FISSO|nr:hypothetical protein FisN_3Lh226 [Fistulifera solaris]|eukprot:GAX15783.1 hypothetical protein FisN_3Lh226 [Fistulifera solaris]
MLKKISFVLVLLVQVLHIDGFASTRLLRHNKRCSIRSSCQQFLSIDDLKITESVTDSLSFLTANPSVVASSLALTGSLLYATTRPPQRLIDDNTLQAILENTYMEKQQQKGTLQCLYKATRDGWKANAFHGKVDFAGSGVVVVQAQGKVFGGYNPNGWRSTDDYTTSTTAFLFRVVSSGRVEKYKVQANGPALFDYASAGPCFGTTDLLIGPPQAAVLGGFAGPNMENEPPGSLQVATILPGQTYDTDARWNVRGYKIRLQEVEVYCSVER